ncbi:B12-binding domain-containing radical SAM protein [Acetobacterium wieringae]|uniref:B12-binding domain-containing radical SAM protein n=1 Tax=Acetobacterium wieringae TaxID=52694 RepID=A0ABY6HDV9_9FIRM|nr:radical SAM protein [Acetobacterium wieringae]UYO61669.1 B12-binding domain-containing radical SAM protein [Acetobacterium wieringae]
MNVILLEHPRSISADRCNDIANAPLSACLNTGYIGGMLAANNIPVTIVDAYLEQLDYPAIEAQIAAQPPTILGIHLVYHWKDNQTLYQFIEHVKQSYGIAYVCVYGFYPTFAYEEILNRCPAIDAALLGDTELTFLKLVEEFPTVPDAGIAKRTDNSIVATRGEVVIDIDALPFPLRSKGSYSFGEVNISGSRGCYGGCTFCYINPYYGDIKRKWRGRSPENIIAEIDAVMKETDIRYFYFMDPNFYGPGHAGKERVLKLARLLKERQIHFGIEARADDIEEETIESLVDAGLKHILIGLESGRDEALKRLNKLTTVADNENALRILRKYGIEPSVGFIMFEPDSTLEDLKVNYDFLKQNALLDKLEISVNVLYHHMIILQGSASYKALQEQERLNISPHSTYEADTDYQNPQVAMLAGMMRDMTNHIFSYMKDTWELSVKKDPVILEKYRLVNQLLIQTFDDYLCLLKHQQISTDQRNTYVDTFIGTVDGIMA